MSVFCNKTKLFLLSLFVINFAACGGGDSGAIPGASTIAEIISTTLTGIDVPSNVNTVPTDTVAASGLSVALKKLAAASDYEAMGDINVQVSNPALDQFSIIEGILSAFAQTGYADARAVNKGPYQAMIKWSEGDGKTSMEVWTVNSKMILINGVDVNRLRFWIEEKGGGEAQLIKGIIDIHTAPSTTNKYGIWRLDVGFYDPITMVKNGDFAAESKLLADGTISVGVSMDSFESLKGILQLKNSAGKGMVSFSDHWNCNSDPCPTIVSQYAYNDSHLAYNRGNTAYCKDRSSYADIFMDYEIFDSAGKNIRKSYNFSFPLKDTSGNWYYYGGWNGRQQLWGNGSEGPAVGTVLTHAEEGNNSTYTISAVVTGTLVKKSKVTVTPADLTGQVLEGDGGVGQWYIMVYDSGAWKKCEQFGVDYENHTCSTISSNVVNVAGGDIDFSNSKRVQVTEWGDENWVNIDVSSTPGNLDTAKKYNVNISTPIFLKYSGSAWERYGTIDFGSDAYNPSLSNLSAYTFASNDRDYWFRSKTGSQIVFDIDASGNIETITMEKQEIIKPGTAIAGNICAATWEGISDCGSGQYVWDETAATLKDGGSPLTQPKWNLVGENTGIKYQWEYNNWSKLTYLTYTDNVPAGKSAGQTVILDPAITFDDVVGKDLNGADVTVSGLTFDGHLFGYTDVWQLLHNSRQNNSEAGLSPEDKSKIVNFPSTTVITGNSGAVTYKIKPSHGFRMLDNVAGVCSATVDTSMTLADVPIFSLPAEVGALPPDLTVKVGEGVFYEDIN